MGAVKIFTNGYIKLYRSLLDWEWYKNSNTKSLFLHCIIKANYADAKFENEVIKRGEFVTSFKKLSEETGMSVNEIRTALKHLILTKVLTSRSSSKYTVITVLNFDKYQEVTNDFTNKSQTINKRLTNESQQYKKNKERIKKNKKEREGADAPLTLGDYKNVFLTPSERQKLADEFGEELAQAKIERLSEYMITSGKSYPNHYARVRSFCKQDKEEFIRSRAKQESDNASYDLLDFEQRALTTTPKGVKND